jgi:hypothetical protein
MHHAPGPAGGCVMSFGISLQTSPPLTELGDGDALSFVVGRAREAEAAEAARIRTWRLVGQLARDAVSTG